MKKSSEMARKTAQDVVEDAKETIKESIKEAAPLSGDKTELDRRYGQIGISAVAAAVRYQGEAKNPAYAPVAMRWDDRTEEAA